MKSNYIGKKVIIRADRAGVFFGTLARKEGQEVELKNCRRLWHWEGACSLHQLAKEGVKNPDNCNFTVVIDEIEIGGVCETIPCTEKAINIIEGVNEWKK